MPDSVLQPAPVSTTKRRLRQSKSTNELIFPAPISTAVVDAVQFIICAGCGANVDMQRIVPCFAAVGLSVERVLTLDVERGEPLMRGGQS